MKSFKKIFSIFTVLIFVNNPAHSADIINVAANTTVAIMTVSAVKNSAQSGSFLKKCSGAPVYCAMAALAIAQAVSSIKGAKDANKTQDATQCYGAYCGTGDGSTGLDPSTGLPPLQTGTIDDSVLERIQEDINRQLENLNNKGYSYNPSTNAVSTPNGSIPASAFASDAGLKGLGLTDDQIREAKNIANNALKNSKYSFNFDNGGGGGKIKPGPGYGKDENTFNMNAYLAALSNKGGGARGVAGLEKQYGADKVGVSGDNIFMMVHRRYEANRDTLKP